MPTDSTRGDQPTDPSSNAEVSAPIALRKSALTRARILDAALSLFRERGFEGTTMRDIAGAAGVATGSAYYYFASKEAIVMAFYEQSQRLMSESLEAILRQNKTLESRVAGLIRCKLDYFAAHRRLLGALSAHSDPEHPLSPFGRETLSIRVADIGFFARAVQESKVRLPQSIKSYLPDLLWLYQMGVILFWIYDNSPEQRRTNILLEKTLTLIGLGLKMAGLPILRPVHRVTAELLTAVYGKPLGNG